MATAIPTNRKGPVVNSLTRGRLARWVPWAILGGSLLVAGTVIAIVRAANGEESGFDLGLTVAFAGVLYVALIYTLSYLVEGQRRAKDRFATTLVVGAFLVAMAPLVSLTWTVIANGIHRFDVEFFTMSMRGVIGEGGGALHAIVGTLFITLAAALISVPVGLFTAIYLVEYGRGRLAKAITFFVDVMTGIPSIVSGLFVFALFALIVTPRYAQSGFAGAIALSVLMIPVVVRSSEEMLRIVPNELREASYALGVPKWLTIVKVVLPTAIAGIATGVVIAIARVIGETAPLMLAVGATAGMNYNLFQSQMASLPLFVYTSFRQSSFGQVVEDVERAWTGALTLILIVLVLNLAARLIAKFFAPKVSR